MLLRVTAESILIIWKIKAIIDLPLSQDLNAEAMIEVI
jgi:hypothetical protein